MGRKRKTLESSSEQESSSEESSGSCSSKQSQYSSSYSNAQKEDKLTKKELQKLILLEKKIKKQERLLKQKKHKKIKQTIKKRHHKKPQTCKQKSYMNQQCGPKQFMKEEKKLFITGIEYKFSSQQVEKQLSRLLQEEEVQGVVDFRIKRKQGHHTYIFVDFRTTQQANYAIKRLNNKQMFDQKISIYYSQDQYKQTAKIKKCYECNKLGHFARQCHQRKSDLSPIYNQRQYQEGIKQQKLCEIPKIRNQTKMQNETKQDIQKQVTQNLGAKRTVRQKSRLNKFVNRDN